MKKTILASAILLAGAANAAEIYNNEGATVSLNGSFRAHVKYDDNDKTAGAKDIVFEDSGSRFDIRASKEIEEGLKSFGKIEMKHNSDNSAYFNNAYVGFESDDMGTVKLGRFIGLNDSLVMNDFTYEGGNYEHQNVSNGTTEQGQYSKSFGDVKAVVGISSDDVYEVGAVYEAAGLTLGGAYSVENDKVVSGSQLSDNSAMILGAQYTVDALTVGAQYQTTEINSVDYTGYGVGVQYKMGQARGYAMYDVIDYDGKKKENVVTLGADYVLAAGVKTYVEVYQSNADAVYQDNIVLGARLYF